MISEMEREQSQCLAKASFIMRPIIRYGKACITPVTGDIDEAPPRPSWREIVRWVTTMIASRTTDIASKEEVTCALLGHAYPKREHLSRRNICNSHSAERESDSSGEVRPTAAQIPDLEL